MYINNLLYANVVFTLSTPACCCLQQAPFSFEIIFQLKDKLPQILFWIYLFDFDFIEARNICMAQINYTMVEQLFYPVYVELMCTNSCVLLYRQIYRTLGKLIMNLIVLPCSQTKTDKIFEILGGKIFS